MKYSDTKGFTLIELLVVIAIIGVLAALGFSSYRAANRQARDARRQADLEQVRGALEMYRTDNGHYPYGAVPADCGNENNWTKLEAALVPASGTKYLETMPQDPGSEVYDYQCLGSGQGYELCATLENAPSPSSCDASMTGNYGVTAPL